MNENQKVDHEIDLAAKELKELAHAVAVKTHEAVVQGAAASEVLQRKFAELTGIGQHDKDKGEDAPPAVDVPKPLCGTGEGALSDL
jgi:hypothetical protein